MALVHKIKQDFSRHRKKAMILAALAVVMLACIGKAYLDMSPRNASAETTATTASPNTPTPAARAAESEENIRQSKLLWKTLRDKRGISSDLAFSFVYQHFNRDPSRKQQVAPEKTDVADAAPKVIVNTEEMRREELRNKVLAASRTLVVRSTVMSANRPVAVINDQTVAASDRILGVGDRISGFTITAIRAQVVEFQKDGVTVAVEMARAPGK